MKFRLDLRLVKVISIVGTLGGVFFLVAGKWIGAVCMLLGSYQFEKNLYRCPHCGIRLNMKAPLFRGARCPACQQVLIQSAKKVHA